MDDILYTGADDEEHLCNLDEYLQRLEEQGLTVHKEKYDFFQSSVEYLGHVTEDYTLHHQKSQQFSVNSDHKCQPAEVFLRTVELLWTVHTHLASLPAS